MARLAADGTSAQAAHAPNRHHSCGRLTVIGRTMETDGRSEVPRRFQFTVGNLLRVHVGAAGVVAVGVTKGCWLRGNGVVLVVAASLACLAAYVLCRQIGGRLTSAVVALAAGGIAGTSVGRLKFDYVEAAVCGILVAAFCTLGFSWLDAKESSNRG